MRLPKYRPEVTIPDILCQTACMTYPYEPLRGFRHEPISHHPGCTAVLFFLAGCNTVSVNDNSARPAWIDNPGNGVSASAGIHVRGKTAQEELAILRAREEFAKRFGVKIEAAQTTTTTVAGGRSSTVGSGVARRAQASRCQGRGQGQMARPEFRCVVGMVSTKRPMRGMK